MKEAEDSLKERSLMEKVQIAMGKTRNQIAKLRLIRAFQMELRRYLEKSVSLGCKLKQKMTLIELICSCKPIVELLSEQNVCSAQFRDLYLECCKRLEEPFTPQPLNIDVLFNDVVDLAADLKENFPSMGAFSYDHLGDFKGEEN